VTDNNLPWYYKKTSLVVGFLCVGPLVLPLIWIHPKMTTSAKVLWTVVVLVLTYLLVLLSMDSLNKIQQMYKQMTF
jgi:hypothetical protein